MYTYIHRCIHIHTYIYMHVHMCIYIHIGIYIYIHIRYIHICLHIYTYVCTHTHTHNTKTHTHTHTCIYAFAHSSNIYNDLPCQKTVPEKSLHLYYDWLTSGSSKCVIKNVCVHLSRLSPKIVITFMRSKLVFCPQKESFWQKENLVNNLPEKSPQKTLLSKHLFLTCKVQGVEDP